MYKVLILLLVSVVILSAGEIEGIVRDARTAEPLENVIIRVQGSFMETESNADGFFRLPVSVGDSLIKLELSRIGYKSRIIQMNKHDDIEITMDATFVSEPVVVTAQRRPVSDFDSPLNTSSFNRAEMDKNLVRTTPEALHLSNVWVQKTNHGGGSPIIRGLSGNQILLLFEGIRLNNSTYRYGPNQYLNTISPVVIGQIEVLKSSGSVQYGSDALGGVVNLMMDEPDFSAGGVKFSSGFNLAYATPGGQQQGSLQLNLSAPRSTYQIQLNRTHHGEINPGGDLPVEKPSSYDETGLNLAARFLVDEHSLISSGLLQLTQEDVPRWDQVAQRGYSRYSFDPQIQTLSFLRFERYFPGRWLKHSESTVSWQQSLEKRTYQKSGSTVRTVEQDIVTTIGLIQQLESQPMEHWRIISGAEYYTDNIKSWKKKEETSDGTSTNDRGLYPDGSKAASWAIFQMHQWDWPRFVLNYGGRFNSFSLDISDDFFGGVDTESSALVANAGLLWKLNSSFHLSGAVSSAFRAPNINDMSTFGPFDYGIEVPVSGLKPEKTLNTETSLKMQTNQVLGSLTFFHNRLTDLIDRAPATYLDSTQYLGQDVYKKTNLAGAQIYGAETAWSLAWSEKLHGRISLSYTFGEDTKSKKPLRRMPPFYGQSEISYSFAARSEAALQWMFAAKQTRLSGGDKDDHRIADKGTPGWSIFNLRLSSSWRKLDLNLRLENLFDQAYRIHGSGVDAPGRMLWFGAAYRIN